MKKGLEFTFVVGVIIAIVVILLAVFYLYWSGTMGSLVVSRTNAIKACEAACLDDRRLEMVNIGGYCATTEESSFGSKVYRIGGEETTCFDLTTCILSDSFGETCELSRNMVSMEDACRIACELDGGVFTCVGETCGLGVRKTPRVCKLNEIGPNFYSSILNNQKCLTMGYCCKVPEENCLVSWRNC